MALSTGGYFDATAETFVAGPLQAHAKKHGHAMTTQQAAESGQVIAVHGTQDPCVDEDVAFALGRNNGQENAIAHTLRSEGHDASEDGTGRGVPLVTQVYNPHRTLMKDGSVQEGFKPDEITDALHAPTGNKEPLIAYNLHSANSCAMKGNGDSEAALETEVSRALDSAGLTASQGGTCVALGPAFAIQERAVSENIEQGQQGKGWQEEQAFTLEARHHQQAVAKSGVRRLTPTECERLQGFPDGWTDQLSDSARYRVLGNAVSVPVAKWIGKRLMDG